LFVVDDTRCSRPTRCKLRLHYAWPIAARVVETSFSSLNGWGRPALLVVFSWPRIADRNFNPILNYNEYCIHRGTGKKILY
jgi:hypothetical protein